MAVAEQTFNLFGRTVSQKEFYNDFLLDIFEKADLIAEMADGSHADDAENAKRVALIKPLINVIEKHGNILSDMYLDYVENPAIKNTQFERGIEQHMRRIMQAYVDFSEEYKRA